MSMDNVDLIIFIAVVIGSLVFFLGLGAENKTKAFRALLIALGLAIILLPLQQRFFCIQTTPVNEKVVSESHPITAGGVSVEVTGGLTTHTRYIVMAEHDDGSIRTLTLNASAVSVYEDAASWEDAHVDKILVAECVVEGTFFGTPVSDTLLSGNFSPEYRIHVPEGAALL